MPWTAADAGRFTRRADTTAKRRKWAAVANSALADCLKKNGSQRECEGTAIKIANAAVSGREARKAMDQRKRKGSVTSTGVQIHEAIAFAGPEVKVDKEKGVIRGLRIINRERRTGDRTYSDRALSDIAERLEGKKSYMNHSSRGGSRLVQDLLGVWGNARTHLAEGYVSADLKVLPREQWLLETAEQLPEALAMSIDARALLTKRGGHEFVNRILILESVDAVTEGGTTHGLFESSEGGTGSMDINSVADLKEQCPELLDEFRASLLEEFKAGSEQEAQVARLTAELKDTREAAEKKTKRLDELELEKKVMKKSEAIDKAIAEAKLPEYAVTDEWRKSLIPLDADGVKAAIEDRRNILEQAAKKRHPAISSERGAGGEEMKTKDLKEALVE